MTLENPLEPNYFQSLPPLQRLPETLIVPRHSENDVRQTGIFTVGDRDGQVLLKTTTTGR